MKTTTTADWRISAKSALTRILNRVDGFEPATAPATESPQGAQNVAVPTVESRNLPPLDFATGRPVEIRSETPSSPRQEPPVLPQASEQVAILDDPAQQRIRDRYIAARFPGVARSSQDLVRTRAVIKAASIYHADGNSRRAAELLDLAIALQPTAESLHLARLDLAFKESDADAYRRTAIGFRKHHPRSPRWRDIVVFARSLCLLLEKPFTDYADYFNDNTFQQPRWMHETWELAPGFTPADLRHRILQADEAERSESIEREAA